jgi:hypothetical protein
MPQHLVDRGDVLEVQLDAPASTTERIEVVDQTGLLLVHLGWCGLERVVSQHELALRAVADVDLAPMHRRRKELAEVAGVVHAMPHELDVQR